VGARIVAQQRQALGQHFFNFLARDRPQRTGERGAIEIRSAAWSYFGSWPRARRSWATCSGSSKSFSGLSPPCSHSTALSDSGGGTISARRSHTSGDSKNRPQISTPSPSRSPTVVRCEIPRKRIAAGGSSAYLCPHSTAFW